MKLLRDLIASQADSNLINKIQNLSDQELASLASEELYFDQLNELIGSWIENNPPYQCSFDFINLDFKI